MDYERVIAEMLSRIITLENKVAVLEGAKAAEEARPAPSKKYIELSKYLNRSGEDTIVLSFEQIEKILGFKLPPSAYTHRAFWANTQSHAIAHSWLSVNYQTAEADLAEKRVKFLKEII